MDNFDDTYSDEEFEMDKEVYNRTLKFQQRMQQEENAKQQQKVWEATLKKHGLTQKEFNDLIATNPEATKQHFQQGLDDYVSKVKRNRDPVTGRFVSGKPKQPQHQESTMGMGRRYEGAKPQQKRYDPAKNRGTNEDITNMVLDVLGDDPIFNVD
jgi:hypothetical protein